MRWIFKHTLLLMLFIAVCAVLAFISYQVLGSLNFEAEKINHVIKVVWLLATLVRFALYVSIIYLVMPKLLKAKDDQKAAIITHKRMWMTALGIEVLFQLLYLIAV